MLYRGIIASLNACGWGNNAGVAMKKPQLTARWAAAAESPRFFQPEERDILAPDAAITLFGAYIPPARTPIPKTGEFGINMNNLASWNKHPL